MISKKLEITLSVDVKVNKNSTMSLAEIKAAVANDIRRGHIGVGGGDYYYDGYTVKDSKFVRK